MSKPLASLSSSAMRKETTTEHIQKQSRPRSFNPAQLGAMTFLIICSVYFLLPFFWLIVAASKTQRDLVTTFGLWFAPHFALFNNLRFIFIINDSIFVQWLFNTLIYAGVGAVVGTVVSSMAGYALAKYIFRGRSFIFSLVLGSVLVPTMTLALPLFLLMSTWNLTNTYWSVLLPSLVSPFGVYLSRIYAAASIPDELLEAARIDGAGELRTFTTIAMRLMMPALVTVFLFQFVAIWNNYFLPLIMLSDERLFPLTVGLRNWGAPTLVLSGALVSTIPLLIGCAILQRYWRNGLGAGSIKA